MLESYFPQQELSLFQRILLIWAFIAFGLVIALQASQSYTEPRPRWTLTTGKNKLVSIFHNIPVSSLVCYGDGFGSQ